MNWQTIYTKIHYVLLLSVSELMWLVVRFIQKDTEVFLKNYPILTMEPAVAWQHIWLSVRQETEHIKKKIPDFIPIAFKMAFAFSLIIFIGLVSLGSLIGMNRTKLLEKQADRFGGGLATQAAYSIKEPLLAGDNLLIETILGKLFKSGYISGISVYNDEHVLVASYGLTSKNISFEDETRQDIEALDVIRIKYSDMDLDTFLVPIRHRKLIAGYIALSFDRRELKKAKIETRNTVILIAALTMLLGILASIYLSRRITRPIGELMDVTKAMQEGTYDYKYQNGQRKDELGVLLSAMNEMGKGLLQKEKVEKIFSRYVSPQVANQVLKDLSGLDGVELGGQHVEASIFFADVVGFTSVSETMEPQQISKILNVYFSTIAEAVHYCGGHVDKYIGDCVMVGFGVPLQDDDHAFKSLACAWMILRMIEVLNEKRKAAGQLTMEFRIGANAGTMLAGNMGSSERMEYTVVGDSVNLASRLLRVAEPGNLVITELMMLEYHLEEKVRFDVQDIIQLRGKKLPVRTLKITDISTPFREDMLKAIPKILDSRCV